MRLVCPKCAAQYEVDASAIPESGRDVQCANCGDTWFQEPFAKAETATDAADKAKPEAIADQPHDDPDEDQEPSRGQQTKTDTSVLDILRREAELDAAARSGMPIPDDVETDDDRSPDFALSTANARNRKRRLHLLTPDDEPEPEEIPEDTATDAPEPASTEPATTPKSELPELSAAPKRKTETAPIANAETEAPPENRDLPDVESLNSTLRSADDTSRTAVDTGQAATDARATGHSGRTGFSVAVLLAVILFTAYALSPRIAAAFPAAQPFLDQYVGTIDLLRLRFSDGLASLVTALKGNGAS